MVLVAFTVLEDTTSSAVVLPYTKADNLTGQWTIIAYSDSANIGIETRKPFPHHTKIDVCVCVKLGYWW
jgi:hypothetical protein